MTVMAQRIRTIVSGQLPMKDGALASKGYLGKDVSVEDGYAAARQCAINGLAALAGVIDGDFDRVKQVVRVGGFVASASGFTDQPKVINGASDFLVEVFGEAGRHARAAVGVSELPLGAAVEVEFTFLISSCVVSSAVCSASRIRRATSA